ncbi:hypothetical protein [Jannaschia sp. 2305UL9-9]|uniref:hypothetical protein n=1 Tax=Jannaschia sp. 2305UL9-9 TaxID=3121638 RepID=UPI00352839F7
MSIRIDRTPPRTVIVGGPPRSGTRFVTDALNRHPDVAIEGEPHAAALRETLAYIDRMDAEMAAVGAKYWQDSRADIFWAAVRGAQKQGLRRDRVKAGVEGFKLPRIEHQWSRIHGIVGPMTFVFCLRPFPEHWLSIWNRWPEQKIEDVAALFIQSIVHAGSMADCPEITLVSFGLPQMAANGASHLSGIGNALNLADVDGWAQSIDQHRRANAADKFTCAKRTTLTPEEQAFIDAHPNIAAAYDDHWRRVDAPYR